MPDPEVDPIRCIFYAIFDDIPQERGPRNLAGVIVVDAESCCLINPQGNLQPSIPAKTVVKEQQKLLQKCGMLEDLDIIYVPTEVDLFLQIEQLCHR